MSENLDQLRQVAERATPGNWMWVNDREDEHIRAGKFPYTHVAYTEDVEDANALHIATFDPSTALGLIDRVEAAEESHRLANVMLRTVLEEMGSGPETDPIIKARQLVARAEAADAAVARVREVAHYSNKAHREAILEALDGGEQE